MSNILSDITVIDLTQNVAGPYCTQILGDMGAQVIKIERPGTGDDTRQWKPPAWGDEATTFLALNRNKKSVCVDINDPKGQEIIRKLVEKADVFIHSLKPGSAEARGLGHEQLREINDTLIYSAISAFGEVGPLKSSPGYDPLIQAYSGIMSVTGNPNDDPVRVGVSMIDMATGMWALIGILVALIQRAQTGKGTKVGTSLLETGLAWMILPLSNYIATKNVPKKYGTGTPMVAPYEAFRTKDGWIIIAAGNNRLFKNLCDLLNLKELLNDPRFLTNKERVIHRDVLHQKIEERCLEFDTESLINILEGKVPCSSINTTDRMCNDNQVKALEMIKEIKGSRIKDFKIIDLPFRLEDQRGTFRLSPPLLGEHTTKILKEIGYTSEEIELLNSNQIINTFQ